MPFDAGLQALIVRLVSLTQTDPTISPLLAVLQAPPDSTPTVGSLVARVMLLDRLLARLTRVDPLAARRLALALPALHALVSHLLLAALPSDWLRGSEPLSNSNALVKTRQPAGGRGSTPTNDQTSNTAIDFLRPDGAPSGVDAVLAVGAGPTLTAQSSGQSFVPPSPEAIHQQSRRAGMAHGRSSASVSGRKASPVTAPPVGGGAVAGSASGGIGAAAPAAVALLAVLAAWLLDTFLSGRVPLDLVPRRATLLASRLERPG